MKKIYFNVIYKDDKGVIAHSVESLMSEHFSQVASIYSQIRTIDYELINYIAKKLAFKHTIVAADIGCGDGRYSIKLIEKLRNRLSLTCVDANYEMLQQISKISSNFQNLQTKHALAEKLPFDDNSLDCIFSFNAIHHFKINEFAKECNRVLKNNGLLFIYTRLKEQNESNIWCKFFPDFSKKENRLFDNQSLTECISNQTSLNLKRSEFFEHKRSSDIQTLVSKAEKKHYSTFSLYTVSEFEKSLGKFKQNIYQNFSNPENIQWVDENTMFVFQKTVPN
uniref:SAM-dependent methyltransferase n=2 Tax=environmental samples TaxID=651140 RepID=A0A075G377_9ARCH|nr:SAM-dependent methyltransferase [uncultured marine thaumarchaeote KM3_03_H02]AIE98059.1 SAM-dependent methyltransferase [uncultured marine thaumarchaeote KM3_03_H03]